MKRLRWLWLAALLGGAGQSLSGAASALLAERIGGSVVLAGLPQTVLVIGAALAALGLSRLTARTGRGRALAAGALAAAMGALIVVLAAQARSLPWVLAGNLLLGAGNTAVMLARYAAADLVPPGGRARAMGTVLTATTIGAVAGPNLLSAASSLGSRWGLAPLTGPYLVAMVAFGVAVPVLAFGPSSVPARRVVARQAWSRRNVAGLALLGGANLVMVAVMTMAPLRLHAMGSGLTTIGLVISGHIAGMFLPSPLSGWLTDRFGPGLTAMLASVTLGTACALAAVAPGGAMLAGSMVLLGIGWNLALLSGSALLTSGVPSASRPSREGWGETGMGIAASCGGFGSGLVMTGGGYGVLAAAGAVLAVALLPAALSARHSSSGTRCTAASSAEAPAPSMPTSSA